MVLILGIPAIFGFLVPAKHRLPVGGLASAILLVALFVTWGGGPDNPIPFLVAAPIFGFLLGLVMTIIVLAVRRRPLNEAANG